MKSRNTGSKNIGEKGDVDRYILYMLIILILIVIIIALFFGGAQQLIEALFIKDILK